MPPAGQICTACRARKVRCDGALPKCGPCSKARRPTECEYATPGTLVSATSKSEYLKKGAACQPCRRKKKKCDAIRPFCTTCKVAGKESECAYEDNDKLLTDVLLLRAGELEERVALYEKYIAAIHEPLPVPVGPSQGLIDITSGSSDSYPSLNNAIASSSTSHYPLVTSDNSVPLQYDFSLMDIPHPETSLLSLFTNPDPSPLDLSLTPPDPLSSNRGLVEFREVFLRHRYQLGCIHTAQQLLALLVGDMSGTNLHPSFIPLAHLVGCQLWQKQNHAVNSQFAMVEYEQYNLLMESLKMPIDPVSEVQIHLVLSTYHFMRLDIPMGLQSLTKAFTIASESNLTYPPDAPDDFVPTELEFTTVNVLTQLIYADIATALMLHVPRSLDPRYEDRFLEFARRRPTFVRSSMSCLRARSAIHIWHTIELCRRRAGSSCADATRTPLPQDAWLRAYWPLLEAAGAHANTVSAEMIRTTFGGTHERDHALALKFVLSLSLTTTAVLHWLLGAGHEESRRKAFDQVSEIAGLSRGLRKSDCIVLDPLLGMCWGAVAQIVLDSAPTSPPSISQGAWDDILSSIAASADELVGVGPFLEEPRQIISEVIRRHTTPQPSMLVGDSGGGSFEAGDDMVS